MLRSDSMESKGDTTEDKFAYLENLDTLRENSCFLDNSFNLSRTTALSFNDKAKHEESINSEDVSSQSINNSSFDFACNFFNSDIKDASSILNSYLETHKNQQGLFESFIPGTLSSMTLEHFTDSLTRHPFRAITGNKSSYGTDFPDPRYDGAYRKADQNPFGAGTIGESSGTFSHSSFSHSNLDSFSALQPSSFNGPPEAASSGSYGLHHLPYYPQTSLEQARIQAIRGCSASTRELLRALGVQSDSPNQTPFSSQRINDFSTSADLFSSRPCLSLNSLFSMSAGDPQRAARLYKNAASLSEPTYTWCGKLPNKKHHNAVYSTKVFLGGVPWDITEAGLLHCFSGYGPMRVEWPGQEGRHVRNSKKVKKLPVGYVYILFEWEHSVKELLRACTRVRTNQLEYYYYLSSKKMNSKEVQVIPWIISDSNFVLSASHRLELDKTVFVGALHGMLTAEDLALVLDNLFGNVVYSGIDTDKYKYPIGSGRVTFGSFKSYLKAVTAAFVTIKTSKFTKKIQIDPYLEESSCSACHEEGGIYFCREFSCFKYYCNKCWKKFHSLESRHFHRPLMRNNHISGASRVVDPSTI